MHMGKDQLIQSLRFQNRKIRMDDLDVIKRKDPQINSQHFLPGINVK